MSIKTILFDLDGTLLPMDEKAFIKVYFELITEYAYYHLDIDHNKISEAIWQGVTKMVLNDGLKTNEEVFWLSFRDYYQLNEEELLEIYTKLNLFYENEFYLTSKAVGSNENALVLLNKLKEKGYHLILATNPIFPLTAIKARLSFIGLNEKYFDYISSYENAHFSKPNIEYYKEILKNNNLKPSEVIMIGNDIKEDIIPTANLGIDNILINDCLLGDDEIIKKQAISFETLMTKF